jgi:hypothetical protein
MIGRGRGETLGWLAALTAGVWLSLRVARWVTETAVALGHDGADEPVREMVQEVLVEHRTDDSPIVQAFQEAVDAEEAEETASVA